MEVEKIFKHLDTLSDLSICKVSTSADDSAYKLGETIVTGEPWLCWNNICYIDSPECIWTHGVLYRCDSVKTVAFDLAFDDAGVMQYDKSLEKNATSSLNSVVSDFSNSNERGVYLCDGDDKIFVALTNVQTNSSATVMYGHFVGSDSTGMLDAYAKVTVAGSDVSCSITACSGSSSKYELVLNDDGSLQCIKNGTDEGFELDDDGALDLA